MASENRTETGLAYAAAMPFQWTRLDGPPDADALARYNESALRLLQVALVWDEAPAPEGADDAARAHDLARVEAKLNLLLELFGELLAGAAPAAVPLGISSRGLHWNTRQPPGPGDYLDLTLYLVRGFPKPLRLPAEVLTVTRQGPGFEVRAGFHDLSASVQDGIDKIVFRYHRRRVAQARRGQQQSV